MLVESSASDPSTSVDTARVAKGVVVAVLKEVALYLIVYGGFDSGILRAAVAAGEAFTPRASIDDDALSLRVHQKMISIIELLDSLYPLSHLGMRRAREVEMKMKMPKRMSW